MGALLLSAGVARGLGTFAPADTYGTAPNPLTITSGDFNRDGRKDVATANTSGNVSVFLAQAGGTFAAKQDFPSTSSSYGITSADLNGDHKLDLAVAGDDLHSVAVLRGNGNGTFQGPVSYLVGTYPSALIAADVNRDGRKDLIVANEYGGAGESGTISVLLGRHGGFRSPRSFPAAPYPVSLRLARMDRDRRADLVVLGANGNVFVFRGRRGGRFTDPISYQAPVYDSYGIATGDLNRDHRPDVVVSSCTLGGVVVMLNRGNGRLTHGKHYAGGRCADQDLAIADIDRNGKADVVAPNFGSVDVMRGNGHGKLGLPQTLPATGKTWAVALLRINGDRGLDIVAPDNDNDKINVFLSQP